MNKFNIRKLLTSVVLTTMSCCVLFFTSSLAAGKAEITSRDQLVQKLKSINRDSIVTKREQTYILDNTDSSLLESFIDL